MKHIYTVLLLFLLTLPAWAQRPLVGAAAAPGGGTPPVQAAPLNHYTHVIDSVTQHLSRVPISSGILYDRVMPLAGLHAFTDTDTSSAHHFRQAYLELYTATYAPGTRTRPAYVRERAVALTRRDSVPLAVFDAAFHLLDTLAYQDNLLTEQNGLLHDVPGRVRSPFVVRELVLAAALTDTVLPATRFYLAPELLLSTRGRVVSGLLIDFGNQQGAVPCLPGQAVAVSYGTPGPKVLHVTVSFSDGTQAQARARLYVRDTPASRPSLPLTASISAVVAKVPFTDYVSSQAGPVPGNQEQLSLYGEGQALTVLHHPDSQDNYIPGTNTYQLRNPVIFIDGFDANDERGLISGRDGAKSIYQELQEQGILNQLDLQERDLIILNFPKSPRGKVGGGFTFFDVDGGTDYIERNAMVLVQLLNDLKPRLAGPAEKFTIIGPSMAGLISRYALAYMEKQQQAGAPVPAGQAATYWDHNTRLWVSLDSPHQGANVPLGDQEFLRYYQGLSEVAGEKLDQSINSPASRQMLVHHQLARSETPRGAPGFRDRFMLALRDNGLPGSFGYPQNLRRVGLANGRLDGAPRPGAGTCDYALQLDIFLRSRHPNRRKRTFFLGIRITNSFSWANVYFTPSPNDRCKVFHGELNFWGSLFSGFNVPVKRRTFVSTGSVSGYDLAPGGSYDTQDQIRKQTDESDDREIYDSVFRTVVPEHSFIPTVSALGFQYQSMSNYQSTASLPNPYAGLLGRDLACNDEIPFDDYYAPANTNTFHVQPDAAGSAFLFREIAGVTRTPVFVTAPAFICPGSSGQFSVQVCNYLRAGQPGTTYTWTSSDPAVQIISGQGTGTVSIAAPAGYTGEVVISVTARRQGYADSAPAQHSILIRPGFLSVAAQQAPCEFEELTVDAISQNINPASLKWFIKRATSSTYTSYATGQTSITLSQTMMRRGTVGVRCEGLDICTNLPIQDTQLFTVAPCGNRTATAPQQALFPNPADGYVDVTLPAELLEDPGATAPTTTTPVSYSVTIYDGRGKPVLAREGIVGTPRLDVRALPTGLYHVQLRQGAQVYRRQLSIQH